MKSCLLGAECTRRLSGQCDVVLPVIALARRASAILLTAAAVWLTACEGPVVPDPEPEIYPSIVNTANYPDGYYPADPARVGIRVFGDRTESPDVHAKVDVVFLIDESGSMADSDPTKIRRTALKDLLTQLPPNYFRVGVVVFSDDADILGGFTGLTNDFSSLRQAIDDMPASPGGLTNIAAAMELSNSLLSVAGANHRIGILLTDGFPQSSNFSGYDVAQDAQISSVHVPFAIENDISYHVVHLLNQEWTQDNALASLATALLQDRISGDTGGQYIVASEATELNMLFSDIVTEIHHTLVVKNIWIDARYRVGPNLYTVLTAPGSIAGSPGLAWDASAAGAGVVSTSPIQSLDLFESLDLTTTVTSYEPVPPMNPAAQLDIWCFTPDAKVYYDLGDGNQRFKVIPQVNITWLRAPEVLVRKRLEPNTKTLTISVTNYIAEGPIQEVILREIVAGNFEGLLDTAEPDPDRILPADLPSVTEYVPQRFIYHLGQIEPFETKAISFGVTYFGPDTGNVVVDHWKPAARVTYKSPDGSEHEISAATSPVSQQTPWYGDLVVDAQTIDGPDNVPRPDLIIVWNASGSNLETDLNAQVSPTSNWMWNDSGDNGWLPAAEYGHLTTPEALNVRYPNRLWFRLANIGIQSTLPDHDVTVTLSYGHSFSSDESDYLDSGWTEISSKTFAIALGVQGGRILDYIEWMPQDVLTGPDLATLTSNPRIYFKVSVKYDKPELRYLNNTAFLELSTVGL